MARAKLPTREHMEVARLRVLLIRDTMSILHAVLAGYSYDPGDSDLDNEQPIHVRMTLGAYRQASRLKLELEKL